MAHTLLVTPTDIGVGLTAVTMGLVRTFEMHGVKVNYYKPVLQAHAQDQLLSQHTKPIPIEKVENMLSQNRSQELLEMIVAGFEQNNHQDAIMVIEGLIATQTSSYAHRFNVEIAKALDAEVVLVATPSNKTMTQLKEQIEIIASYYGGIKASRVLGTIINKVGGPVDPRGATRLDLVGRETIPPADKATVNKIKKLHIPKLIGIIPWDVQMMAPRVKDVAPVLHAKVLHQGELAQRRIQHITMCARTVPNMLHALKPDSLVITAGDRDDIVLAACMAALKGIKLAALILTGGYQPSTSVMEFCQSAIATGLPILTVQTDSLTTAMQLQNLNRGVPADDQERLERVKDFCARQIDKQWLEQLISSDYRQHLSPVAFRYRLLEKAKQQVMRIILPEGDEPRTLEAANICVKRQIAHCVLLGNPNTIKEVAANNGIELQPHIEIIDPDTIREQYIKPLTALREHKGLTEIAAKEQLHDNIILGTMILQQSEVDGLVSGAMSTTANTVRPALQLIKTAPNVKRVSSIFFMCLPDQVLIYGDCAINQDPDAETLADIAIQSAESAMTFGINPRIAMISYSTGSSGVGEDVEKVKQATELVKQQRPDLIVDGPLQYDAALIENVAKTKAPNSPVAGKATVFIFPDLNTGNTTYKAVQRSANALAIGPMLQGLNKPVNDLSRGASVDDIVYTIALTAIQAQKAAATV